MLNQKFINKLLTLAILSICSSVVNASNKYNSKDNLIISKVDNFVMDNNSNNSTSDSNKSSPRSTECNESEKMSDKRIKYNPEIMWFDYQALFDKTKNIILKKDNNKDTGIEHTDFMENDLARDAVFGTDDDHVFNYDKRFLDEILNCNVCAYYFALGNCFDQIVKMSGNCEENSDEMKQLKLNYKYLLALVVSFSAKYNDARMEDYIKLSNGLVPSSICENARDIKKMNLSEIINPLLSENNNVLEKN